ncbi:nitrogen fixation protein NifQ [Paraburkholderia sp. RAU2J]|uniref:nitrogen fixation protein NifQ n=1 Tax=Paraburkholderia sp. RAU2J TaxID=1938810 RepID=UPI000F1E6826|nr:nitrogen fixation protein NifQ [Paraburkholderia sp. RAU2J]RKT22025.1 nitrogen fixation protein NifQ [Paraburkholderia sp. RAU2J]
MSDDPLARAAPAVSAAGVGACDVEPLSLPLDPQVAACMNQWLHATTNAASADTRLFAKLIAARDAHDELALLGLRPREWHALLARHFTHAAEVALPRNVGMNANTDEHISFVHSLHALLLALASLTVHADDAHCLATIIAHACLRPDHLWRDLGLAGRTEVTWMLTRYFPTLVTLNVANLRWKKFLAAQRALSLGLLPGPAPGCPGCEDYGYCFPPQR